MKQSSIEWLIEKIIILKDDGKYYFTPYIREEDLAKAKEMHKQEVIDAFWNGDNTDCLSEQNSKEFAEQYYNETYYIKR